MELFQSITESTRKKCPRCGKRKLKRLLGTGAGVIFKGTGFYGTDYRSDSYKTAAEKEKPSADVKTETKESPSKAEVKPQAKAKTDAAASKKKN
jgi:predicted nucleic acid-binding Zn ribbon protein